VWPGIIRDPRTPARVRDLGAGLLFFDTAATENTYDLWPGYRKLERDDITPAFPFRFGLSYTTFALSNLRLGHDTISADDTVATLDVTNTGDRTGEEVVQLYVGARGSTVERAPRSSRPSQARTGPRRHADRPPRCARRQPRVLRRLSRLDRRARRLRTDRRRHALDDRALHAKLAIHKSPHEKPSPGPACPQTPCQGPSVSARTRATEPSTVATYQGAAGRCSAAAGRCSAGAAGGPLNQRPVTLNGLSPTP